MIVPTIAIFLYASFTQAFSPVSIARVHHDTSFKRLQRYPKNNDFLLHHDAMKSTALNMVPSSPSVPRITQDAIQELSDKDFVIIQDFIPSHLIASLRKDVTSLRSKDKFNIAKIGQDSSNLLNTQIRVAETCFLGSKLSDVPSTERDELYNVIDTLRKDLAGNSALDQLDSNGELVKCAPALDETLSELLYAYYPQGGFYRRHVDAISGSASVLRAYSLLLYLNDDWKESDGGCLRVHLDSGGDFLPEGEEPNYLDVEPKAGTLVLFKSEKIPHEVLNTEAERLAIIGWYNRPYTTADVSSLASEEDKKRLLLLTVAAALVTIGVIGLFV